MTGLVKCELLRRGLVKITLDRPDRRNALNIELLLEFVNQLNKYAKDGSTRVAIVCGAGKTFSSGMDLAQASNPECVHQVAHAVANALQSLRHTPLVTIAAAHGGAFAGGAGLMAACDIAIGSSDLQIGFPEARRGLLPALICSVLSMKVREGDLRELFLVGNSIDAIRAREIGLLQRVVSLDRLLPTAEEIADGILAGGPKTIVATKLLLNEAYMPNASVSIEAMIARHNQARASDEATEGLAAFLEKRSPQWASE